MYCNIIIIVLSFFCLSGTAINSCTRTPDYMYVRGMYVRTYARRICVWIVVYFLFVLFPSPPSFLILRTHTYTEVLSFFLSWLIIMIMLQYNRIIPTTTWYCYIGNKLFPFLQKVRGNKERKDGTFCLSFFLCMHSFGRRRMALNPTTTAASSPIFVEGGEVMLHFSNAACSFYWRYFV